MTKNFYSNFIYPMSVDGIRAKKIHPQWQEICGQQTIREYEIYCENIQREFFKNYHIGMNISLDLTDNNIDNVLISKIQQSFIYRNYIHYFGLPNYLLFKDLEGEHNSMNYSKGLKALFHSLDNKSCAYLSELNIHGQVSIFLLKYQINSINQGKINDIFLSSSFDPRILDIPSSPNKT